MKKIILFFLAVTSLTACTTDYYTGEERTVLEGRVVSGQTAVSGVEIMVFPTSFLPESSNISELDFQNPNSANAISYTKTDQNGNFSLSFPKNESNDVYYIRIQKGHTTKYYGYISEYNVTDYYINVGALNF